MKLIDYNYRNLKNKNIQDGDFGFHRSTITSLFDCVPLYRKNETKLPFAQKRHVQTASAPEKCMRDFLVRHFSGEYKIYREVPLGEIYPPDECDDSELKEYIENGSRIDFLVCKDKKALLAIEVDGEQHRNGEEEEERHDELKNRCFGLLENQLTFLRINTDGSGCWVGTYDPDGTKVLSKVEEVQKMRDYLGEAAELQENREFANENGNALQCTEADKDDLLNYYKDFLKNNCLPRFGEYMGLDLDGSLIDNSQLNHLPPLDYNDDNYEEIDHGRQETDDYYFCKYGIAYAFEYAMLYDIMLRIHNTDKFGVCSFGSGGYIDAWSLAYARANLQTQGIHQGLKLYYQGIDIIRWPTTVFAELINEIEERDVKLLRKIRISVDNTERMISDFTFRRPQLNGIGEFNPVGGANPDEMNYNVLMFSKLLNVVSSEDLDAFIERLSRFDYGQRGQDRPRDYYICVSHSPAEMESSRPAVRKIVEMFEEMGFESNGMLEDMLGEEQYRDLCESYEIKKEEIHNDNQETKSWNISYRIRKQKENGQWLLIEQINNAFSCNDIKGFLDSLSDHLENAGRPNRCKQMRYPDIAFQIIKLTKREG